MIHMRMFAIWCDDNIHAIMATHEAAEWLMDCLMDSDADQEYTWAIYPVNVSIEVSA